MLFEFTHGRSAVLRKALVLDHRIMVAVNHYGSRVVGGAEKAFQGIESPLDRGGLGADNDVIGICVLGDARDGVGTL